MPAPLTAANGPAIVEPYKSCDMLDANKLAFKAEEAQIVISNNSEEPSVNNITLKCKATLKTPPPSALQFDYDNTGFVCGITGDVTTNWHQTISASGESTLTCKFNRL
jgi:hypothetical protein